MLMKSTKVHPRRQLCAGGSMCIARYITCTAIGHGPLYSHRTARAHADLLTEQFSQTSSISGYLVFRAALDCPPVGPPVGACEVGLGCGRERGSSRRDRSRPEVCSLTCIHNVYACAPLIDGLGHAVSPMTVLVSCSRTRMFRQNPPHYFLSTLCAEAVSIAHEPLCSM